MSLQNMKLHVQDASPADSKKYLCGAGVTSPTFGVRLNKAKIHTANSGGGVVQVAADWQLLVSLIAS